MAEQDTFVIEDTRKKAHNASHAGDNFEAYSGSSFGSQITFTVGCSYLLGTLIYFVTNSFLSIYK